MVEKDDQNSEYNGSPHCLALSPPALPAALKKDILNMKGNTEGKEET